MGKAHLALQCLSLSHCSAFLTSGGAPVWLSINAPPPPVRLLWRELRGGSGSDRRESEQRARPLLDLSTCTRARDRDGSDLRRLQIHSV